MPIAIINRTTGQNSCPWQSLLTTTPLVQLQAFPHSTPTKGTIRISPYTPNEISPWQELTSMRLTSTNFIQNSRRRLQQPKIAINALQMLVVAQLWTSRLEIMPSSRQPSSKLLDCHRSSPRRTWALSRSLLKLVLIPLLFNSQTPCAWSILSSMCLCWSLQLPIPSLAGSNLLHPLQ
jgi:hypothetical protein